MNGNGNLTNRPAPPQGVQVDPVEIFAKYFGLGLIQVRALQVNVVSCMCGKCHGFGVQLEGRLHFPMAGGAEVITRGDAQKAPLGPIAGKVSVDGEPQQ